MSNFTALFIHKMRHHGLQPPTTLIPGKYHRFPGINKGASNRSGWCCISEDLSAGHFGDWASGLNGYLRADAFENYSRQDQIEHAKKIKAAKEKADHIRLTKQRTAVNRAFKLFLNAERADSSHPYLQRKGINKHDALTHKECLMLPITNVSGFITSLQFIAPNGTKKLLSNGRKSGCFIHVAGDLLLHDKIIICEGWATGCTLAEHHPGQLILAAIDAGNLKAVALSVRNEWPNAEITIAGDDDRLNPKNPGKAYALDAAIAADALLAFPQWPDDAPQHLSDFNDLALWLTRGDV